MNIFFLDKNPNLSAEYMCDKHIPKMLLETCQMLSTAVQRYAGKLEKLYKPAYEKHPMTIWVGNSLSNFNWALEHATKIEEEYELRFNKIHKSGRIVRELNYNLPHNIIPEQGFTPPPQCMPDQYKLRSDLYVNAYRDYYKGEKEYFAKWIKGRPAPEWWAL